MASSSCSQPVMWRRPTALLIKNAISHTRRAIAQNYFLSLPNELCLVIWKHHKLQRHRPMKDHAFYAGWDTHRKLWIQRSWTLPVYRERMQIPGAKFIVWFSGLLFCFLWPYCVACGILNSPNRDWTWAPAVKALSRNHWTAREVPRFLLELCLPFTTFWSFPLIAKYCNLRLPRYAWGTKLFIPDLFLLNYELGNKIKSFTKILEYVLTDLCFGCS